MRMIALRARLATLAFVVGGICGGSIDPNVAQTTTARIDEALQNITALVRPGRVGYATFWDGNKYVQCRRLADKTMRCEAAGFALQPSLRAVLTGERLDRIATLGWVLDPSFGNYVRSFAAEVATARIADQVAQVLADGYAADVAALELKTSWVADVACPPRNGPSQNLAGIVNDAPSMRSVAIYSCSYAAKSEVPQKLASTAELVAIYGATTAAEIQRLRINTGERIYVVFDAGIGYVQCAPETAPVAIYCEAQSAESWAALSSILTPERVSLLHKAGYADPGRAPNYSKTYAMDKYTDSAIATEILTILYDVYGYVGATKLEIKTEQ